MEEITGLPFKQLVGFVGVATLSVLVALLNKFAPKLIEGIWRRIITSKETPNRLNSQEKHIMIQGVIRQMEIVRARMGASRILLFQEKKNGTDSLNRILDVREIGTKRLEAFDGVATEPFQRDFEDFRKNVYTTVHNTNDSDNSPFTVFLKALGSKSFDVFDIKHTDCAFLIIYENHKVSNDELQSFAKNTLSACNDSIIAVYEKQ